MFQVNKCHTKLTSFLRCKSFHTTPVFDGKAAKRRKFDRIDKSPNLACNIRSVNKTPSMLALENFDDVYPKTFGPEWHSIRLALLSKSKFCAVVNNLTDKDAVMEELKSEGCYSMQQKYNLELQRLQSEISDKDQIEKEEIVQGGIDPDIAAIRPSLVPQTDEIEPELNQVHNSMSVEDGACRVIAPEAVILGGSGPNLKKTAKTSSMFLHMPSTKLRGLDEFVDESKYYSSYDRVAGIPIGIVKEPYIQWPEKLEVMTFPKGNVDHFQPPRRMTENSPMNYYCMDAASVLPVIMLNIQKGDSVLDLCSAPGGKSLVCMQTLRPSYLLCNDISNVRMSRVLNVMDAYFKNFNKDLGFDLINYKRFDGSKLYNYMPEQFDKVLCDVPCFTDRHSLYQNDANIFHTSRAKEKLRMPQIQTDLLQSALRCVKPGGSVVYSTCTMSPIQNDGVVYNALKTIWEETKIEFTISDLSRAVEPLQPLMKFAGKNAGLRYGQLVVPHVTNNFGPMYFAKINRIA